MIAEKPFVLVPTSWTEFASMNAATVAVSEPATSITGNKPDVFAVAFV